MKKCPACGWPFVGSPGSCLNCGATPPPEPGPPRGDVHEPEAAARPGLERAGFPSMPHTLDEIERSVEGLPAGAVRRVASILVDGDGSRDNWEKARRVLGKARIKWGVCDQWRTMQREARLGVDDGEAIERDDDGATDADLLLSTIWMVAVAERDLRQYRESGVVSGLEVSTCKDSRVCAFCYSIDGKVFDLSGIKCGDLPPYHPGCRCVILPCLQD